MQGFFIVRLFDFFKRMVEHKVFRVTKTSVNLLGIAAIIAFVFDEVHDMRNNKKPEQIVDAKEYFIAPNAIAQGTPFKITVLKTKEQVQKAKAIVPDQKTEGRDDCKIGNFFADRRTESQPNNVFCRTQEGMLIKALN